MSAFRKRMLLFFIISNAALLTVSLLYAHITALSMESGVEVVSCIFKHNMKLYCPGCGGSRSLVYLLRLDIIRSFIYYPALPVCAMLILDADIRAVISFVKNSPKAIMGFRLNPIIVVPVLIMLNFIVKNILLVCFGIDVLGDIINL